MREFCIILTKMKAMSLCLSYFAIFLKYSKESRSFLSHVGIQNVPSDICYDVAHYQVPSKKNKAFHVPLVLSFWFFQVDGYLLPLIFKLI